MITVSVADIVVGEQDRFAGFVVRLSAPSAASVSVNSSTANGTAVTNWDFVPIGLDTQTFAPGETGGEAPIWEINGSAVIGAAGLGNPGPAWHVKGSGDFNGDGYSDILWQDDSGNVAIWGR